MRTYGLSITFQPNSHVLFGKIAEHFFVKFNPDSFLFLRTSKGVDSNECSSFTDTNHGNALCFINYIKQTWPKTKSTVDT